MARWCKISLEMLPSDIRILLARKLHGIRPPVFVITARVHPFYIAIEKTFLSMSTLHSLHVLLTCTLFYNMSSLPASPENQ